MGKKMNWCNQLVIILLFAALSCSKGFQSTWTSSSSVKFLPKGRFLSKDSLQRLSPTCSIDLSRLGWGLISVSGEDRIKFLQGLTTNDFTNNPLNSLIFASFLTNKGKVFSYNVFFHTPSDIKILCEQHDTQRLYNFIQSYIFPLDKVFLQDQTPTHTIRAHFGQNLDQRLVHSLDDVYHLPYNGLNFMPNSAKPSIKSSEIIKDIETVLSTGYITLHPKPAESQEVIVAKHSIAYDVLYAMIRILARKPVIGHEIIPIPSAETTSEDTAGKESVKPNKVDYKLNLFELGLADRFLVRDKGCYTGQEIISKALRSLDLYHTKQQQGAQDLRPPSMCRQQLRGFRVVGEKIPTQDTYQVQVDGDEVEIMLTSSCAQIVSNLFKQSDGLSAAYEDIPLLTKTVCKLLKESQDEDAQSFVMLLNIEIEESKVVEEMLRQCIVLVDSRLKSGLELKLSDEVTLRETSTEIGILDYSYPTLLSNAKTLSEKDIQQLEGNVPTPAGDSGAAVVSEEERKRLKLEAIAKKIAAMKANKSS